MIPYFPLTQQEQVDFPLAYLFQENYKSDNTLLKQNLERAHRLKKLTLFKLYIAFRMDRYILCKFYVRNFQKLPSSKLFIKVISNFIVQQEVNFQQWDIKWMLCKDKNTDLQSSIKSILSIFLIKRLIDQYYTVTFDYNTHFQHLQQYQITLINYQINNILKFAQFIYKDTDKYYRCIKNIIHFVNFIQKNCQCLSLEVLLRLYNLYSTQIKGYLDYQTLLFKKIKDIRCNIHNDAQRHLLVNAVQCIKSEKIRKLFDLEQLQKQLGLSTVFTHQKSQWVYIAWAISRKQFFFEMILKNWGLLRYHLKWLILKNSTQIMFQRIEKLQDIKKHFPFLYYDRKGGMSEQILKNILGSPTDLIQLYKLSKEYKTLQNTQIMKMCERYSGNK